MEKGGRFLYSSKNEKLHRMWIIREIVRKGTIITNNLRVIITKLMVSQ